MHADQIFVLHEQKIVEQGTHSDLIAANGRYAKSWREQILDVSNIEDIHVSE